MKSQDRGDKNPKIQSITISISTIFYSAIQGIIGYIAVYFFKPLWEKFMKWWYK
jgi:hypothetical protein